MKQRSSQWTRLAVALAVVLAVSACGKKKVTPPPPPPPPPPAPTATLTANPNTINAGQVSTLTWHTTGASEVTLDSVGKVGASGSTQVLPSESTTYRLVAKGDGGTQEATTRVTVNPPPTQTQTPPSSNAADAQLFEQNMKDVFFDYDSYDITGQYTSVLQADARFLQQHPEMKFTIEGHCDERGSTEYNLALGDNRALATKQALVAMGVPANRIRTISYGKEKPFCSESTEACWQQNRRAHFVYGQ